MPICTIGSGFESNLEDGRRLGVLGQPSAHAVDARADFVGGFRRSWPHSKLSWTWLLPSDELRLDADDAGHGADRLFHGTRDQLFDLQRADAGIAGRTSASAARTPASGRRAAA